MRNIGYRDVDPYFLRSYYEFENFTFTENGQLSEMTHGFFTFLLFFLLPLLMLFDYLKKDQYKTRRCADQETDHWEDERNLDKHPKPL